MSSPKKTCFVTIGATASFSRLIAAVISQDFLDALQSHGYTDLLVQYGQDGKELFESTLKKTTEGSNAHDLKVSGFDLDKSGLERYMHTARKSNGVVISHAGSGTVLDALRMDVPLIVVPNEELLDNHQVELADALAEQNYVVRGKLETLDQALTEAEELRKKQKSWPPPNAGQVRQAYGLKGVIDDEMGFLD